MKKRPLELAETYENKDIFNFSTLEAGLKEDIAKVDSFVRKIKQAGIPLRNVSEIRDSKILVPGTYDHSQINRYDDIGKFIHDGSFDFGGPGRYIGRKFNLLSGSGHLEYGRQDQMFNFGFVYTASNSLEKEILLRINSHLITNGVNAIIYGLLIDNANLDNIKEAYAEIQAVDKKLKFVPKLSRLIDRALKRK